MTKEIKFTDETMAVVQRMLKRYPEGRQKSAVIPILHLAQMEFDGWLDAPVMDYVASILNIKSIEVYEVASFYSMFNLKPVGKCLIEVCRTGPCWLLGAEDLVRHIEKKLNIRDGQTTPDGMFTLRTVECLAACGTAPVIQVGEKYHENMTCEAVDQMIGTYAAEGVRKTHYDKKHIA